VGAQERLKVGCRSCHHAPLTFLGFESTTHYEQIVQPLSRISTVLTSYFQIMLVAGTNARIF